MIDDLINSLQRALDNQDGFSISLLVTRIELLGYRVELKNRNVVITKENK